ncbi:MAG: type II secretion system minor pseudopilin GspI [Proteobacteria bacterium]|nr:type II secretion system minor pseudopilin GspI [Pseudomonadota bacterium]
MIRSQTSAGFTLLEVMIALVIVGLTLLAMAGKMGSMLNAANTMRNYTYASWIAHNKITEMRLANVIPEVSSSSGEVRYAGVDWAWRAVVSETGVENLYRVDVSISFPGADPIMRPVTGFIGEPVPPGQSNRSWSRGPESSGVRE